MSLFLYNHPIENSLFDVFDDDFFNYPLIKRNHFNFGCEYPRHMHRHRKNTLEKQLARAFNNHEIFDIVDFTPKINLSEDENHYYIHADLPGMTKDQVKMELNEDRILTISGERESIYDNTKSKDDEMEIDNNKESNNETKEKEINKEEENNKEENEKLEQNEETTETKNSKESKEKKNNEDDNSNEKKYSMIECSYGKFSRSFSIPEDADLESVQAKMENGALEVLFNKVKQPKNQNRTIQIQ